MCFLWPPVVSWSMTIRTDTICNRTTDPEMSLGSSLGLNVTMALAEAYVTQISMVSGGRMSIVHQHGFRWLIRPQATVQSTVVTGAMDINSDPGCCMVRDTDMALCSSLAPDSRSGHSDHHGAVCGMVLRHQNDLRRWPRHRIFT